MSTSIRDSNLYTLLLRQSPTYPNVLQLIDASRGSEVRYLRVREDGKAAGNGTGNGTGTGVGAAGATERLDVAVGGYDARFYDAPSSALLASISASSLKAKTRKLTLHNPDVVVGFEFSGNISFEWTFIFEDYKFRWTRSGFHTGEYTCSIDRKPDPSVQLCIAKEPSRGKDGVIQLLDYAMERFDFKDPKGLEIAMYTSLISILDAVEDRMQAREKPPSPPPKPVAAAADAKKGKESAVAVDEPAGNPNEVFVRAEGATDEYAQRCVALLADPNILYVIIKTRDAKAAAKAVEVADATKRARHRVGLDQEGRGLFQYLIEEDLKPPTPPAHKGPKVIDLNDAPVQVKKSDTKTWKPPLNISIFLSKIELPDLNPSRTAAARTSPTPARSSAVPINGGGSRPNDNLGIPSMPGRYPSPTGGSAPAPSTSRPASGQSNVRPTSLQQPPQPSRPTSTSQQPSRTDSRPSSSSRLSPPNASRPNGSSSNLNTSRPTPSASSRPSRSPSPQPPLQARRRSDTPPSRPDRAPKQTAQAQAQQSQAQPTPFLREPDPFGFGGKKAKLAAKLFSTK